MRGDRVVIYLPMIPEAAYAMLAARASAPSTPSSSPAFRPTRWPPRQRSRRQGRHHRRHRPAGRGAPRSSPCRRRAAALPDKVRCLVVKHTGDQTPDRRPRRRSPGADGDGGPRPPAALMNAEDPLFILYTSGSTGKPKGLCTKWWILVYAAMTTRSPSITTRATSTGAAPTGLGTGHSTLFTGLGQRRDDADVRGRRPGPTPVLAGLQKHKVNQFYTAPTAICALMARVTIS